MSFKTVPAAQGLKWLTDAVNLILKNPGPYALMGLVIAVAGLVPLLGSLALAVLGQALYGGIMYAARTQESGGAPDFKHLFQAFNQPGKLPKMLVLCVPGIVLGVVLGILAVFSLGAMFSAGMSGGTGSGAAMGMGIGMLLFLVIALPASVLAYALTFFATPRVMFDGLDAIPAMRESLKASLANIGALVVYSAILIGAVMLIMIVIGLLSAILAQLLLMVVFVPVVSVAAYRAWREVFGGTLTQELPPVDAPNPPAPPSPPPSFEA